MIQSWRLDDRILLVALRDKFSGWESRHLGCSRSYLLASRITAFDPFLDVIGSDRAADRDPCFRRSI
jgi:hypothetical protein